MPQLLEMLSQLLEIKRPTLTADDVTVLAEDVRIWLLDQRILVPARSATHVTCDACHDDHIEEAHSVKASNGTVYFRIRCPDAGWVEVAADRLRQWTVDVERLVAVLATAIDSNSLYSELMLGIAWRIGVMEMAGERYELIFVRNSGNANSSLFERLRQMVVPARTVIIGQRALSEDAVGFVGSLPLFAAFEVNENGIQIKYNRVRSLVAAQPVVSGNVFRLRGEFWELSFDGATTHLKDSVGLGYISRLLMEPNRDIPAVILMADRAEINSLVATGSSGEVLDAEGQRKFRQRCRELPEELEEARENNDLGRIEMLETELDQLARMLEAATGLGGRSRVQSDTEKARKAVSAAVSRDIERIGGKHERLGQHLTASITSGLTFRYAPERPIDWLS